MFTCRLVNIAVSNRKRCSSAVDTVEKKHCDVARCTLTSFCATKAKGSPHLKYKVERSIDEEKEDKEPVIPMLVQLSFLTKRTTPTCMCGRVESRFAAVKRQVGQCENTRAAWQLFFTART